MLIVSNTESLLYRVTASDGRILRDRVLCRTDGRAALMSA